MRKMTKVNFLKELEFKMTNRNYGLMDKIKNKSKFQKRTKNFFKIKQMSTKTKISVNEKTTLKL